MRWRLIALFSGFLVVLGCVGVFAKAADDVSEHNGLTAHDAAGLQYFIDARSTVVDNLAKFSATLGTYGLLVFFAALAGALLWWRGARVVVALAPIVSIVVAGTAVSVMKPFFGRPRPPADLHLVHESDLSFPSGHATNSTAAFMTIALVLAVFVLRQPLARAAVVAAGALVAGAIGVGRLVLGVHWPTDVLAGWALGLGIALLVTIGAALATRWRPAPRPPGATALRSQPTS